MKVHLPRAVENFPSVGFYQPLFEAIINAIEANATEVQIHIDLQKQKLLDDTFEVHIIGFRIIDNGDGFILSNRDSFSLFYSDAKQKLGCKGIGRLSWLKVFELAEIDSFTGKEHIQIPFSLNFQEDNIKISTSTTPRKTSVKFSVLRSGFEKDSKYYNLEQIKTLILQEMTVKLFLLFLEKRKLKLSLYDDDSSCEITQNDLPKLKKQEFEIISNANTNEAINKFQIYYDFIHAERPQHEHWLCADERKVKKIPKEIIPSILPDPKVSSYFLICSDYLNKQVTQERAEFLAPFLAKEPSLTAPITINEVNNHIKSKVYQIFIKHFPNLEAENKKILEECSNNYPYLVDYFKNTSSELIIPNQLISKAKETFDAEKEKAKKEFANLLVKKKIDSKSFIEKSQKVSEIASLELAEYILYRNQIIDAIRMHREARNGTDDAPETFVHNLFMPMGANTKDENATPYETNLWLLDDKYMGYTHAYSDNSIKKIKADMIEKLKTRSLAEHGNAYEPDLVLFYSDYSGQTDLVVVELKKSNASSREKSYAMNELSTNIGHILRDYDNIRRVFGYVITELDEETITDIGMQNGVLALFADNSRPYFYNYNANIKDKNGRPIDCHTYILSFETLEMDARARNKTFINILTKNTNK